MTLLRRSMVSDDVRFRFSSKLYRYFALFGLFIADFFRPSASVFPFSFSFLLWLFFPTIVPCPEWTDLVVRFCDGGLCCCNDWRPPSGFDGGLSAAFGCGADSVLGSVGEALDLCQWWSMQLPTTSLAVGGEHGLDIRVWRWPCLQSGWVWVDD